MIKLIEFFRKKLIRLTLPIAKRPLSNNNSMPRVKKNTPKPDKPIPIS